MAAPVGLTTGAATRMSVTERVPFTVVPSAGHVEQAVEGYGHPG